MRLRPDGTFERSDIWREGDYLDLWSVPHFLSGIVIGLGLFLLGFDTRSAFIIAFLLMVAWEMFEAIAQMDETRWNRTLDVVVGMTSCVPAFYIAALFSYREVLVAFLVVGTIDAVLSFFGWRASAKAAVIEKKLRAEYKEKKERFKERREALKTRWKKHLYRRRREV